MGAGKGMGATQVNHVVIGEQKNARKGSFLCTVAVRADRVYDINFMKSWKKGYTSQQPYITI